MSTLESDGVDDTWWSVLGLRDAPPERRYLASLYYAFSTMTTVGYGDVVAQTDTERGFAIVGMMLGATVFGYVVGGVASLVAKVDASSNRKRERMDEVKAYLKEKRVSKSLRLRVRKHFEFKLERKSAFNESVFLGGGCSGGVHGWAHARTGARTHARSHTRLRRAVRASASGGGAIPEP